MSAHDRSLSEVLQDIDQDRRGHRQVDYSLTCHL